MVTDLRKLSPKSRSIFYFVFCHWSSTKRKYTYILLAFFWGRLCCCSVVTADSLWPSGLQHTRLPCPSPSPGACSDSCPMSRWCHPTISSSVIPFSSCLQSFPASGSFPVSQFFVSGGQSIGVSASASVLSIILKEVYGWTKSIIRSFVSLKMIVTFQDYATCLSLKLKLIAHSDKGSIHYQQNLLKKKIKNLRDNDQLVFCMYKTSSILFQIQLLN